MQDAREARLVRSAVAGDREAFGALATGYRDSLYSFAARMLGDRDAALDAAQEALVRAWCALDRFDAIGLSALHVMTTLTGSAVIALAHAEGALTAEDAWAAATVDERWQSEQWGLDDEAEVRAGLRRAEFMAASRCLACLRPR